MHVRIRQLNGLVAAFVATTFLLTSSARAADWQEGGGADWQKVLAAARAEGKVVVIGRPEIADPFITAFRRDTGIAMEFLGGVGRDLTSRLEREMNSGRLTLDVVLSGANGVDYIGKGLLDPIKPRLMLPGVTNPQNWADGKLKWVDNSGQFLLTANEYLFGWPLFNTAGVKIDTINTWQDLLRPEFKGRIASFDPRPGGPGQAAAAYLADRFGIDWVKRLYVSQQVKLARDSNQLTEWVARGVYPIGIGTLAVGIEHFRKGGIDTLQVKSMQDGPGSVLGGSSVALLPKGAPHPNAATVFLNWYASQPAQTIFATVWQTPSRRTDVKVENIPPYVVPQPGVTYLDQYAETWYIDTRPKLVGGGICIVLLFASFFLWQTYAIGISGNTDQRPIGYLIIGVGATLLLLGFTMEMQRSKR
jgi:ABC-type Fe3+ transport system substrate-binding protein